ncbi:MAG: hypothetical protein RJA57_1683, partial [Bacteroidota bacterium]
MMMNRTLTPWGMKTCTRFAWAFSFFLTAFFAASTARAAETNHVAVYQGIGNTYAEETSSISISAATLLIGTNFTFVSRNPADPVYSGNNVPGFLVYRDAFNNLVRIYVVASRPEKSGSVFRAMYAYVADSTNADAPTGDAYLIVFPGYASAFPGTGSIATSSDPVDNVLNDLLSVITPGSVAASQSVCSGLAPAPFTSVTPATTTSGTITYQWQMSTDNISFTDITGANNDVYAPGPVSAVTYFRRMATNTQGNAAASNVLTITISAPPAAPSISPSGTVPFCSGLTVDLTASTTAPTYKWFLNGTLIPGASAQIYSASAAGSYRVLSINASGCESDTSSAVTVVANQAPVTTCPSNVTVNNSPGTCGQTVTYSGTITGTPAPSITYAFTGATTGSGSGTGSGSVFGLGVTTVTITASNTCSTTTCSFTVTVTDNEAPTASNVNSSYSCLSSVPAADAAVITDEADNCGTPTVTFQSGLTTNNGGTGCSASPLIITRYYRVQDGSGNFILATHTITVVDNTAPSITSCPGPVSVSCASSVPAPNTTLVTATENCGGTVTVTHVSDEISAQTCASRYTITRTYRATDACGNFTDCTQTITVNDQTGPTVTCPSAITVSCASAVPAPSIASVTASDGCGGTVTVT